MLEPIFKCAYEKKIIIIFGYQKKYDSYYYIDEIYLILDFIDNDDNLSNVC